MAWLGAPVQPQQQDSGQQDKDNSDPRGDPSVDSPQDSSADCSGDGANKSGHKGQHKHALRCVKDTVEEDLFARRRDLFTGLELVFFDTTSHYFHGQGRQTLGKRGKSKDFRPHCPQMVVGLVLDSEGRPVCTEMWPGNTADVTALQERFGIGSVCLVADRGMISKATMAALGERGWSYILGCRLRATKEFREQVLAADAEPVRVLAERAGQEPQELAVREVILQDGGCRRGGAALRDLPQHGAGATRPAGPARDRGQAAGAAQGKRPVKWLRNGGQLRLRQMRQRSNCVRWCRIHHRQGGQ